MNHHDDCLCDGCIEDQRLMEMAEVAEIEKQTPTPQSSQKCENCRFWCEFMCRRVPPVFTGMEQSGVVPSWRYPCMDKDDWCGKWQQQKEKTNEDG